MSAEGLSTGLNIGGLVPFSALDWPGRFTAVVFVQGCPWRCAYCHNPHLQPRGATPADAPTWPAVRAWLQRRVGLLDGVVFSGGEPTLDPALPAAMADVRALGFCVGLHTAGIYPRRLQPLLRWLDWVGLDVKAPLADDALHTRITGVPGGTAAVRRSLALLQAAGVAFECRTTAHPALLDDAALLQMADEMSEAGVQAWALQPFRATGCTGPLAPLQGPYPAATTLARLRRCVPGFSLRCA